MKKIMLIVALVVLASQVTMAQQGAFNVHRFQFSDTLETLSIEDALGTDSEMAQRKFLIRASYDYIQNPINGNDNGRNIYPDVARDIHTYTLGFGAMITKRFMLSATIPFHRVEFTGAGRPENEMGDVYVQGKVRVTGDNAAVNVALIPFVSLPTGEPNANVGIDDPGYGLKVAIDKSFGAVKLFANLGYAYAGNSEFRGPNGFTPSRTVNIDRTNLATGAFGLFYKATSWLGFTAEYNRDYHLDGGDFRNVQAVNAAVRLTAANIHWFLGSGIESARGFENQDFNIYAGAKFAFGSQSPEMAKPVMKKPAPKKVDAVKEATKELSVKRNIQFRTGSATIKDASYTDLDTAAAAIVKYQDQIGTITVEGHTDSSGRAVNNKRLSQKRADSVKAYLVSKGVKAEKITAIGYGEERLAINPEKSAADRASNRRVEFKVNAMVTK